MTAYKVCILGGGIGGLSLAIDLKLRGHSVLLIEKGTYPRHKVCGEYVSMESHNYLFRICPSLKDTTFPSIKNFKLTSTGKKVFSTKLDMGGFGISRYLLELRLYEEAIKLGVNVKTKTKAQSIIKKEQHFTVDFGQEKIQAMLVIKSTGRHTKVSHGPRIKARNYVGVKYHVEIQRDDSLIEIHNFPGGYCGISNIEGDKACLCYMINSALIVSSGNSIHAAEKHFLWQNPRLKELFNTARFVFNEPVTTSGINFSFKQTASGGMLYLGDAAGTIAPLTGNGMSMALRSSSVLASLCDDYFNDRITKELLMSYYENGWKKEFQTRVRLSKHFQKLSEYPALTKLTIGLFNGFPALANSVIQHTHGLPF